jgi:hypothetical protein
MPFKMAVLPIPFKMRDTLVKFARDASLGVTPQGLSLDLLRQA